MTSAWDARDPERIAVGRWLGPPLSPEDAERVLNIVHFGNLLANDFPDSEHERWHWFVKAATVLEGLHPDDPLVLWTIACFLDRFPRGRYRADDGSIWYDPPEKALSFPVPFGFLERLDPELYALAKRRLDWRSRGHASPTRAARRPPGL